MIYLLKRDENYLEIVSEDTVAVNAIHDHYTFIYYEYGRDKHKYRKKTYLLEEFSLLPLGLFYDLKNFLNEKNYDYEIDQSLKPMRNKNQIDSEFLDEFIPTLNLPAKYTSEKRDYQYEAVIKAYNKKRCLILSHTSSGKTLMLYIICMLLLGKCSKDRRILIIVPRQMLVEQMFRDYSEFSKDYTNINVMKHVKLIYSEYDKIILDRHHIVVSTWQSLKDFKDETFFDSVKYLFVDEVHNTADEKSQEISEKCIIKIITACSNTRCRVGFTGTIFSDEKSDEVMKRKIIEGLFGKVYKVIKASESIEKGYIPPVEIRSVVFDYGEKLNKKFSSYDAELKFYKRRKEKLDYIAENVLSKSKKNVLILYKGISYGQRILDYYKKKFPKKVFFIVNSHVDIKERVRIQQLCDKRDDVVIVGSYATFGEGISINNLHFIVLMEDVKSRFKVIQAVGRGLRKHHSKDVAIVYDMVDKITKVDPDRPRLKVVGTVYNHWRERKTYYDEEGYSHNLFDIIDAQN